MLQQSGDDPVSFLPGEAAGNDVDGLRGIPGEDGHPFLTTHKGCSLAVSISVALVGHLSQPVDPPADIGFV